MENNNIEMKMNEIINGNGIDDFIDDDQLSKLNNVAPVNDENVEIIEVPQSLNPVPETNDNVNPVTQLSGVAGKVQEALGGEQVITPDIVQKEVIPTLPPDMVASNNPTVDEASSTSTAQISSDNKTSDKKTTKTKKDKKKTINYIELENELINNFNNNSKEDNYKILLELVGETSASLAKKLGFSPANRILMSVRGDRNLNEEKVNIVFNYFVNNDVIKARPNILQLITKDMFLGK